MPWKAVLDALPGMVGYWDEQLRNVVANAAYRDFFGMTPQQIRGRHISEVLGPELYEANLPYITAALAGERQDFDRDLVDSAGRVRHTQASYIPDVRDGRVRGVFVLVTDVTARVVSEQRLHEAVGRYRALARSMPGGFVLLFDRDLRYLVAEGAALELFGYHREGLEGCLLAEALPVALAEELEPRYRAALAGETVSWSRQVGDRMFTLTAGPVVDDDATVTSGMVVALDSTATHRAASLRAALHELATAVARNAPWDQVVTEIAHQLHALFASDTAAVIRFTGPQSAEIVALAPQPSAPLSRDLDLTDSSRSAVGMVAATGRPAIVEYDDAQSALPAALRSVGLVVGAAAPVRFGEQLWGAVSVGTGRVGGLTEELLDELASFAQLVEIALGNVQAWSALTLRATTDQLTGLPNRAAFAEALAREERSALARPGYVVIAVDVDEFKQVNDTYGHLVGDEVIVEVARRLTHAARGSDVIARYGGDEFTWLLPATTGEAAMLVAERARAAVADEPFPRVGHLTVSLGVCASADVAGSDPVTAAPSVDVVGAADRALYEAKRRGRNTVVRHAPIG